MPRCGARATSGPAGGRRLHAAAPPPPHHHRRFYATLRRKSHPGSLLEGVAFTGFGLGDSNYTRYQYVPRAMKQRFLDLGAQQVRAKNMSPVVLSLVEASRGFAGSLSS